MPLDRISRLALEGIGVGPLQPRVGVLTPGSVGLGRGPVAENYRSDVPIAIRPRPAQPRVVTPGGGSALRPSVATLPASTGALPAIPTAVAPLPSIVQIDETRTENQSEQRQLTITAATPGAVGAAAASNPPATQAAPALSTQVDPLVVAAVIGLAALIIIAS